jgi:hypothetical protein
MGSEEYALAFSNLGNELDVPSSMKAVLKKFVCHLYGAENQSDVNLVRYLLFKGGKFDEELLPPNEDSLEQHVKRANFQCFIWRRATNSMMDAPSFSGHGWEIDNIGHVHITWMTLPPAPDSVLDFVNCKCKTGCINNRCSCKKANLKCSELCNCSNCQNGANGDTDTIEDVDSDDTYNPVDSDSDSSVTEL